MTTSFNINEFIYDFKNCCNKVQKKTFNKYETITSYIRNRNQFCILISGNADLVRYDLNGNRTIIEHFSESDIFGEVFYMTYFVPDSCVGEYLTYDVTLGMDIRVDKRLSTGTVVEEPGKISFSNNGIHHVKITIPAYENDGTEEEKTRSFAITIYDASLGDPQIIQLGKQKMLI